MSEEAIPKRRLYRRPWFLVLIALGAGIITFVIAMLLTDIFSKQQETTNSFTQVVDLDETTVDPAIWGQNFPVQYEAYKQTAEFTESEHGGTMVPHDVEGDPRTEVASSKLEEDPRLVTMWDGYAFAVDYRHARGHEYMTLDQQYTKRNTEFDQPGTCLNCHASMPAIYDELGDGDITAGFESLGSMSLDDALELADHPVSCIDCHDPETMALRITRPAFENGIAALKANEGVEDYDVNRDATHNEMRSYVCAQCHVEYYFAGDEKILTFPWDNGLAIDDIWEYYEDTGHTDFTHATTGADIVKAQHPEFDIWSQGVHAQNGVSCADCHMNYERNGASKVTNHQITTPMEDVNASCGTCHNNTGDGKLEERVAQIQDRFIQSRDIAFDALVALIDDIEAAQNDGDVSEEQIKLAQDYQNKSSFYIDYVYSENSYGFHAPDYTQTILADALDDARKGQLALKGVSAEDLEASDVTISNSEAKNAD
ncbi:ammonia-forming cytochrome c nitrite reductase subunit c552 [Ancrocorticia populi]|uniref:ammonia-forming cytochrome c nitrite reductase subunit c552 n=1 Tax=Ancrocorticia populi TaxID=2175228 RepID=UPI002353698D|nr:ammonia-forming cytochrome c nitrite reductase subunit c552 [Ancrocorticia populi]